MEQGDNKKSSLMSTAKTTKKQSSSSLEKQDDKEKKEFLSQYGKLLGFGIVSIIFGMIFFGVYKENVAKKDEKARQALYSFEESSLKKFIKDEIKFDEYHASFQKLQNEYGENAGVLTLVLESVSKYREAGKLAEAMAIMEKASHDLKENQYSYYLLVTGLIPLYEELGHVDKAIKKLEKLLTRPFKLYPARIYYDLGRFHFAQNNYEKAKRNFQYVLDQYPNDQVAPYARAFSLKIALTVKG